MLISSAYIAEQKLLHEQEAYGSRGYNWGYLVAGIAVIEKCQTILDYGCGKATMGRTLNTAGFNCTSYDPGVEKFAKAPAAVDLVACVDVLEHIEPDCLDAVLDHIAKLARKVLFVAISTRPAKRWLTDGRNAHLIVQDGPTFWRPKFEERGFVVRRVWDTGISEWVALMEKRT